MLAVAAIPVPAGGAVGDDGGRRAVNLARDKAIVSRLTAIEELAGVDVFCSDKTGTLTRNEMTVVSPVVLDGHDEAELFVLAALASRLENQDPIELPDLPTTSRNACRAPRLTAWKVLDFKPFDPIGKRTEALLERDGRRFTAIKGAPQVLIGMAALDETKAQRLADTVDCSPRGLSHARGGPPRERRSAGAGRPDPDAGPAAGRLPCGDRRIREWREGKMITGDNLAIAREIGHLLGLREQAIRSSQLSGAAGGELMGLIEVLAGAIHHRLDGSARLAQSRAFAAR